jgi:exportin-5
LDETLSSFGGFCDLLGLSKVRDYLVSRRVHEIQEWGLNKLDAEGQALQAELEERLKASTMIPSVCTLTDIAFWQALPLRTTKSFLACSTEKVEKDTPAYKVSCTLWRDALPIILPNLLKFLRYVPSHPRDRASTYIQPRTLFPQSLQLDWTPY